jgi:ABC-type sugar transport system substrate-binding protein
VVFRPVDTGTPDPSPSRAQTRSPAELAEAIRTAVEHGASGLIVEPEDEPAVVDALYEAQNHGAAVLLLDRPVAARGGQSIPCIRFVSFAEPGRQIVQAVLEAGKLLRRPGGGRIIVLHDRFTDVYGTLPLESLTEPLQAAGKPFERIEFEGDTAAASDALRKTLAADPGVAIVLADDAPGMSAGYRVLSEWKKAEHPEFLVAGYLPYDYRSASEILTQITAFGDRSVESFAVKTAQTILSLLEGKPVGERIEVPIVVHKKQTFFVPMTADGAAPAKEKEK